MFQYVAVCCSVLQCVAVCCSALRRVAVCCSVLYCVAVSYHARHAMCVAACCSVLQCVAVYCSVLQCVAVCCSVLYVVYSSVLQLLTCHTRSARCQTIEQAPPLFRIRPECPVWSVIFIMTPPFFFSTSSKIPSLEFINYDSGFRQLFFFEIHEGYPVDCSCNANRCTLLMMSS